MEQSPAPAIRPHPPSRRARREAGLARRREVPLDEHAALPEGRADPVGILTGQDENRLPLLVPIRHGRMSATAFTFYRGAAAVMASDLSTLPTTDLTVQLCGDAHLSNFGFFNGPDRRLVFDINDFDETHPGPFEWDVKRLAASVAVAGRNNGLAAEKIDRAVRASVEGYRDSIAKCSASRPLAVHYQRIEMEHVRSLIEGDRTASARLDKTTRKATRKNSLRAQSKLTDIVDGRRVIVEDPPLITRVDHLLEPGEATRMRDFFGRYLATLQRNRRLLLNRYAVVDMAHKVVGVGSVGSRCLIVLLESGDGDPLFLQFKEATASVLEPYTGASEFEPGERVVNGQRLTQTMGDIFLGWSHHDGSDGKTRYFYFRQLWDGKGSVEVDEMSGKALRRYARSVVGCSRSPTPGPVMRR